MSAVSNFPLSSMINSIPLTAVLAAFPATVKTTKALRIGCERIQNYSHANSDSELSGAFQVLHKSKLLFGYFPIFRLPNLVEI